MPRSATYDAIVLRTHDVGEADRFCILLTRERGKIAARARGVRRLQSRMGGSLLPFRYARIDIHEGSGGFLITGVHAASVPAGMEHPSTFAGAQEGCDMLLHMLEDDAPVPEIFDLAMEFLCACSAAKSPPTLAFTVRLLTVLGMLPDASSMPPMPESARQFLHACGAKQWWNGLLPLPQDRRRIELLCLRIIEDHARRPPAFLLPLQPARQCCSGGPAAART